MEVRAMELPTTMEVNNGSLSGYNSSDLFMEEDLCLLLLAVYSVYFYEWFN